MTSCRCRRNVYMLAVAFLCNFAAYMTLESMQSSLNRGIGTSALCLLYASLVVSSLLLPPLVIAKLDCRRSLALSIGSFAVYTLANFYPKPYTLIPAALFLGMGSSVMWSCAFYYIMQLSQKHADEKKKCIEEVTSEFFGKFTAISHISILVGTLFMSLVFESVGINTTEITVGNENGQQMNHTISSKGIRRNFSTTPSQMDDFYNFTSAKDNIVRTTDRLFQASTARYETDTTTYSMETGMEQCGLYYKFAETEVDAEKGVGDTVMFILLAAYLACNIVAATLCLCLDEVKGTDTMVAQEAVCESLLSVNASNMTIEASSSKKAAEKQTSNNNEKDPPKAPSAFKLIKSTMKILATDKAAWLLIPFTLHYGVIQGFARGVYNASWITCALGIKYVAYVTCMYAAVMIIFCYTFGKLLRLTTHVKIFCFTTVIELGTFTYLLLWNPNPEDTLDFFLLFAVPFLLGIRHSSLSSQIGSIYGKFFPDNRKSGSSLQGIWNPLGSAIAYGLSGPLYPFHMIIMVMTVSVVGTVSYLIAERIKDKPYRKCTGRTCLSSCC